MGKPARPFRIACCLVAALSCAPAWASPDHYLHCKTRDDNARPSTKAGNVLSYFEFNVIFNEESKKADIDAVSLNRLSLRTMNKPVKASSRVAEDRIQVNYRSDWVLDKVADVGGRRPFNWIVFE